MSAHQGIQAVTAQSLSVASADSCEALLAAADFGCKVVESLITLALCMYGI